MITGVLFDLRREVIGSGEKGLFFCFGKAVRPGIQHRLHTDADVFDVFDVQSFQPLNLGLVGVLVKSEDAALHLEIPASCWTSFRTLHSRMQSRTTRAIEH